ncbi:MAG: diguanylate cyclase [Ectothiorhodospiraceae bacterium]|nr:diguanylate cyclase [Ectothiorhodospiraceae bacterium]MCH8503486.1 diguanylate cyclase [Ectothiorhodospiraceae bacterium]
MAAVATYADGPCHVEHFGTVSRAIEALTSRAVDVVLFNAALPGNTEDALGRAAVAAPDTLIVPLVGPQLEIRGWLNAMLRYIARRKAAESTLHSAEEALFEEKERARVTLNSIGDAVLATDTQGYVTYLNSVAESLTGWPSGAALGQPLATVFNVLDGSTGEPIMNPAVTAMQEDRTIGLVADCILIQRNGEGVAIEDSAAPIHDRNGSVTGAVIVFRDASQSREVTRKMAYLAQHDPLTGLPNRALLTERLRLAISVGRRDGKQVALLFVDLDYFKRVNDSLGHAIGDQALSAIAERLSGCVRKSDTVCRLGGDEFVILLGDIDSPDDAAHIAEKMLAAITAPLSVSGHTLQISASVGISIHPDHGADADTIMQRADTAMYQTKADGRDGYRFFEAEMKRELAARGSDHCAKEVR